MPLKTLNQPSSPSLWKAASLSSESELAALALALAPELKLGDRVLLEGPMGVGKSTFARYLLGALGIHQPPEGSPTFAIAHEYLAPIGGIVHIDFYRIRDESEIDDAGIPAYFWERDLIVISEWLAAWPEFSAQVLASGHSRPSGSLGVDTSGSTAATTGGSSTPGPSSGSSSSSFSSSFNVGRVWRVELTFGEEGSVGLVPSSNGIPSEPLRNISISY